MNSKESNTISLKFDNTLSALAGYPFGVQIFEQQAKDKFDYQKLNIIQFPDTIEDIAISFIQGFFRDIVQTIGTNDFQKYVEIHSQYDRLVNKVYTSLM